MAMHGHVQPCEAILGVTLASLLRYEYGSRTGVVRESYGSRTGPSIRPSERRATSYESSWLRFSAYESCCPSLFFTLSMGREQISRLWTGFGGLTTTKIKARRIRGGAGKWTLIS